MPPVHATIDRSGRLLVPRELRRQLGIAGGGRVSLSIEGGELRVRTVDESIRRLQELSKPYLSGEESSVDAFLEWRRKEAAAEIAELDETEPPA